MKLFTNYSEPDAKLIKLTKEDILTSSGKYPDRALSPECTDEVKHNASILADLVCLLLNDLGILKVSVSSGFRTQAANTALPNAAKRSNHMKGLAVDLEDKDGSLDTAFVAYQDKLASHGLYLESPTDTPGWAHLQSVAPLSGNRIFKA